MVACGRKVVAFIELFFVAKDHQASFELEEIAQGVVLGLEIVLRVEDLGAWWDVLAVDLVVAALSLDDVEFFENSSLPAMPFLF